MPSIRRRLTVAAATSIVAAASATALNTPAQATPSAPTITSVTVLGSTALSVDFTRGTGTLIDGYSLNGSSVVYNGGLLSQPFTISDLTAATQYCVTMYGHDGGGQSSASNTVCATTDSGRYVPPIGIPEPPGVRIDSIGSGTVTFTLVPPGNTGGQAPTSYRFRTDGRETATVLPTSLTQTLTGLTNGYQYTITAEAANSAGWSAPGVGRARPVGPPTAPRDVTVTPGPRSARVAWTEPVSDGGSPVTGYRVTSNGRAVCAMASDARWCTAEGLVPNVTEEVVVSAVNALGATMAAPVRSNALPVLQGRPTNVTAVALDTDAAVVTWSPPTDDGGNPRIDYAVTAAGAGSNAATKRCLPAPARRCEFSGLRDGTTYQFTVTATSASGTSSDAASLTIRAAKPGMPTHFTVKQVGPGFRLDWSPPAARGVPVDRYIVYVTGDSAYGKYLWHWDPGVAVCLEPGLTNHCLVGDLPPGLTFNFELVAENGAGRSPAATKEDVPLRVVPLPPTVVTHGGNGSIDIAVADAQGTVLNSATRFTVTMTDNWLGLNPTQACTIQAPATTCTVTGLENGHGYWFLATAANELGTSAPGPLSQVVSPSATATALTRVPSAPRNLRMSLRVAKTTSTSWGTFTKGMLVSDMPYGLPEQVSIPVTAVIHWDKSEVTGGATDIRYLIGLSQPGASLQAVGAFRDLTIGSCSTLATTCQIDFRYSPAMAFALGDYFLVARAVNARGMSVPIVGLFDYRTAFAPTLLGGD